MQQHSLNFPWVYVTSIDFEWHPQAITWITNAMGRAGENVTTVNI